MDSTTYNKEYLSIKEFSELAGMTVDALRLYDKKGILKPAMHGEEFKNSYRYYYAPTQVVSAKMTRVLAEIGVPLSVIKELTENRTPEKLIKLLTKQHGIVADELRFLSESLSVIGTFLNLMVEGVSATENELIAKELPERRLILGGTNEFADTNGFYREFVHFCIAPHEQKLNLSYPIGGYFDSMDEFMHTPSQPTRFFSLDPKGSDKRAAGLYLIGYTRGYYGTTNGLPKRMADDAKKDGLVFTGPVYNTYLFDEMSIADTGQYLLQVAASVKETRRSPSRRPSLNLRNKG